MFKILECTIIGVFVIKIIYFHLISAIMATIFVYVLCLPFLFFVGMPTWCL